MVMAHLRFAVFLILLGICTSGIASAKDKSESANKTEQKKPIKPIFYPLPPEEPRIQFLKSFSSSDDFEKPAGAFRRFIVGSEKKRGRLSNPTALPFTTKRFISA